MPRKTTTARIVGWACMVPALGIVGMVIAQQLANSRGLLLFLLVWVALMCFALGKALWTLWIVWQRRGTAESATAASSRMPGP